MLNKDQLMKFKGTMETYWETGFEDSLSVIFHDSRGIRTGPTFNNETRKFDGPNMDYHSIGWTIFLDKHFTYFAKIYNEDSTVLYEGPLTFSREKQLELKNAKGVWMFVPKEINIEEWIKLLNKEPNTELWTNDLPYCLEKKYDIKYKPGHIVFDNVTKQNIAILNRYIDKDDKLRYTISVKEDNIRTQDQFSKHTLDNAQYFDFRKAIRELEDA